LTADVVKRIAARLGPDCKVVWIEKQKDGKSDQDRGNGQKAEEILEAIRRAINGAGRQ
jgi:hypothetical protein